MAPLTWRDVSAPSFAGVAESQRLAATLLNGGLNNLSEGISEFGKMRDRRATSAVAADALRYTDPAAYTEALRSGTIQDGRTLTPEAIDFLAQREASLLANQQQGVQTAGMRLNNDNQGLVNQQLDFNNTKAREFEAARPEAVSAANEIRGAFALGTREGNARGQQLMQQYSSVFAKAGMSPDDVLSMSDQNARSASGNLALQGAFGASEDANQARGFSKEANDLVASVVGSSGDANAAARTIRGMNIRPEVASRALATLEQQGGALFGPNADPAQVLLDQAVNGARRSSSPVIQYANQGATRNDPLSPQLTGIMEPILSNLGVTMKVTSGGQESQNEVATGKGSRTGSVRHDHGGAGDVEFYQNGRKLSPRNAQDLPILTEIVRQGRAGGITGWGEGTDYMGDGRIHLGFGSPAVWGKGGKSENAPQWLKDAVAGVEPGTAPSVGTGPRPGSDAALANNAASAISQAVAANTGSAPSTPGYDQGLLNISANIQNQAAILSDTIMSDEAFDQTAPLIEEIVNRPDRSLQKQEIVKKLHGEIGGKFDEAGVFDGGLTEDELTDQMNRVSRRYGLAPDVAAAFMKNAVEQTTWGLRWAKGQLSVDHTAFDQYVRQFIDPDADSEAGKLQGSIAQMQALRTKRNIEANVQKLTAQLETAKQEYFNARSRAANRPGVDVEGPRLRYETLLAQLQQQITQGSQNPLTQSNTASQTGR